ncbi:BRO-N domain-containing protein [Pasteurella multocida]|uniref:BRO-N domain-containing protein n=2 Tax=Pasteurella multocida TaxID=747 RepID=UPI001E34EF74|nr:Bro-N domain-containing protein [Pasteurella multocida]
MSTQLSTFLFETHIIRTLSINNEPWFVAKDLCNALDISNPSKAIINLDEDEKMVSSDPNLKLGSAGNGAQSLNLVSESGMYTLILRCRDAVKKGSTPHRFRKWVTAEVLPQIRKTGKYEVQSQQLALPEPKPRGILLDEEAFYVVAKAIAKLNESTFEWEKMMDLFSELESHRNYKTAFNLGVASYNLAQSSEKIIMKNLVQMRNKVWKKEIEDFIFSNPHLQNHTENKLVHYLR